MYSRSVRIFIIHFAKNHLEKTMAEALTKQIAKEAMILVGILPMELAAGLLAGVFCYYVRKDHKKDSGGPGGVCRISGVPF